MASPFTVRFALATAFPLLACACGAASSPNPAGTSGSTGPAEVPVPAAVQAVYAKLASLYTTGTADLDGDGRAEYTRTVLPDGSVRDVIDSKGDGVPSLVAVRDRAGNESITLGRGGPWLTRENRVGPPRVVVTTSDTQLDGILDRRVTVTYDVPASSRLVRTETWNATSGTFVLAQETVLPIAVPSSPAAAASCDDGFGASWPGNDPRCLGFSSNLCVNVMEGGGGGYCDDAQFKAIQEALLCAAGTLDASPRRTTLRGARSPGPSTRCGWSSLAATVARSWDGKWTGATGPASASTPPTWETPRKPATSSRTSCCMQVERRTTRPSTLKGGTNFTHARAGAHPRPTCPRARLPIATAWLAPRATGPRMLAASYIIERRIGRRSRRFELPTRRGCGGLREEA
jgi:hypothetical protein